MSEFAFFNEVKESKHEEPLFTSKGFLFPSTSVLRTLSHLKGTVPRRSKHTRKQNATAWQRNQQKRSEDVNTEKSSPHAHVWQHWADCFCLCSHIFTIILHCLKEGGAERAQLSVHGGQEQTANVTDIRRREQGYSYKSGGEINLLTATSPQSQSVFSVRPPIANLNLTYWFFPEWILNWRGRRWTEGDREIFLDILQQFALTQNWFITEYICQSTSFFVGGYYTIKKAIADISNCDR